MHRLPLALATLGEPGAHGFRQALGLDAVTRFDEAFGKRKRVVKLGLAGKVAHTKIVEPIERTWPALGAHQDVDAQFPSEHEASIACARARGARCTKFLAAAESAN
jgi:hypothetical protein